MRRTLRTRTALLTFRQRNRLEAVFAADERAPVEVTWAVYHVVGVLRRCVGTDVGRRRTGPRWRRILSQPFARWSPAEIKIAGGKLSNHVGMIDVGVAGWIGDRVVALG